MFADKVLYWPTEPKKYFCANEIYIRKRRSTDQNEKSSKFINIQLCFQETCPVIKHRVLFDYKIYVHIFIRQSAIDGNPLAISLSGSRNTKTKLTYIHVLFNSYLLVQCGNETIIRNNSVLV